MVIAEMFFWWYTAGWGVFVRKIKEKFMNVIDFFSMPSLVKTLFKPYRQISAAGVSGTVSLEVKFRAFLDRLISRIVGFFARLILLITGTIIIVLWAAFGLVTVVIWPFVPMLPIAGIILAVSGVLV